MHRQLVILLIALVGSGITTPMAYAAEPLPEDARFFGTYCGEVSLRYEETRSFLGIEGRTRTHSVSADVSAHIGFIPTGGGRGLLHGKGIAVTEEMTVHFSIAGPTLAPGRARGVVWAPGLGRGEGTLTLTDGGDTLELVGLGQRLRLTKDCNNTPPVVEILSPIDGSGSPWGEQIALTARVSDTEDEAFPPTRLVWTSDRDGRLGYGWHRDVSHLSQGAHRIRLTATDSGGRTSQDEVTLQVRNNPPEPPTILSPVAGETYTGSTLVFRGRAGDRETGRLWGDDLVWSSDLDGQLGTGEHFTAPLSLGRHVVTLTATDAGGGSSTASVGFEVSGCVDGCPPTVVILSPDDYVAIDDRSCITVVAEAHDAAGATLGRGSFSWSTTYLDGVVPVEEALPGDGPVIELCELATTGTDTVHSVSVLVVDADGRASLADTVRIYVIFGGLI